MFSVFAIQTFHVLYVCSTERMSTRLTRSTSRGRIVEPEPEAPRELRRTPSRRSAAADATPKRSASRSRSRKNVNDENAPPPTRVCCFSHRGTHSCCVHLSAKRWCHACEGSLQTRADCAQGQCEENRRTTAAACARTNTNERSERKQSQHLTRPSHTWPGDRPLAQIDRWFRLQIPLRRDHGRRRSRSHHDGAQPRTGQKVRRMPQQTALHSAVWCGMCVCCFVCCTLNLFIHCVVLLRNLCSKSSQASPRSALSCSLSVFMPLSVRVVRVVLVYPLYSLFPQQLGCRSCRQTLGSLADPIDLFNAHTRFRIVPGWQRILQRIFHTIERVLCCLEVWYCVFVLVNELL